MKAIRILIVLGAMASLLAAQTPAAQNAAPAGNVENGKKIFSAYGCYQCHGYVGQGGGAGALAGSSRKFDGVGDSPLTSRRMRVPRWNSSSK